jgi:transposase
MSLRPDAVPELPTDTAKVAKAVFKRKQNVYLLIGDQLADLFAEVDFAPLYAADGKPAVSPNLLALVTVFQFMENLPDREAADAVRSRIDWKYALHLALSDTGFDASVLSEFRDRLARHDTAQAMFEQVLQRLQALKLLAPGGRQRTDATYVLGATQVLNRVQRVAETLRLALEELGEVHPAWLRAIALPHWYERYGQVLSSFRLPRQQAQQKALALDIGRDGFHLLDALAAAAAPPGSAELPAVVLLRRMWAQEFERQDDGPQFRPQPKKLPGAQRLATPHDPDVRYSNHGAQAWEGYATHFTETCDADRPHLITNVTTPAATSIDSDVLPEIHAALARRRLLPQEHLVDAGYTAVDQVLTSWQRYGVRVIGPFGAGGNWQAGVPDGFTLERFDIDWAAKTARCPQGATSKSWYEFRDAQDEPVIQVRFANATCQACSKREQCTRATTQGRHLNLTQHYRFLRDARLYETTADFRQEYAARAGVEGTISEAVRSHGARRTRYRGHIKTAQQALITAIAINLKRAALWLLGERPGTTRPRRLACLAPC